MASRLSPMEDLLFIKKDGTGYVGYSQNLLLAELTDIEKSLLTCIECEGILKDACLADKGYKCQICVKPGEDTKPAEANRHAVGMLQVRCPLFQEKCEWYGTLSCLVEHLASECSHLPIECPYGCTSRISRSEYHLHSQYECSLRPTKCGYCSKVVASSVLNDHYTKCRQVPVNCPNHCCSEEIPQDLLISHLDNHCPLSHVNCPFDKFGCSAEKMPRKDIEEHESESLREHMRLLLQCLEKVESAITTNQSGGTLWKIDMIKDKLATGGTYIGPYFFVGLCKFQIVLIAQGKQANRISFYVRLMRGEMDASLQWPFKGKMTFTLLSKKPNEKKSLKYTFLSEVNNPNSFTQLAEENACCVGFTINNAFQHLSHEKLIYDNAILLRASVEVYSNL